MWWAADAAVSWWIDYWVYQSLNSSTFMGWRDWSIKGVPDIPGC